MSRRWGSFLLLFLNFPFSSFQLPYLPLILLPLSPNRGKDLLLVILLNSFCIHQVSVSCHTCVRTSRKEGGGSAWGSTNGKAIQTLQVHPGKSSKPASTGSRHCLWRHRVASVRESWFFPRKTDFLSGRLVHLVVLPQIFKNYTM